VAYGGAAIPLCYCYTWGFVDHGTAQISIMSVQVLTGFGFVIGYYILNALETTKGIAGILVHVFRLFPPYDLGEGLINISASYYRRTILFDDVDIFQWDIAGRSLTYLSMQSVAYLLAVLCMESAFSGGRLGKSLDFVRLRCSSWQRRQTLAGIITEGQAAEDDDVLSERLKLAGVASMNEIAESAIFIRRLCKVYPPPAMNPAQGAKVAIKCVDFALNKGDCLGLLGANGAGKSTLQNIIMGTTNASAGEVLVYGHPLEKGSGLVGFCPQVDPLIDFMTVRETLSLYGYLKGVGKGSELINEVTAVLSKVALLEFANILATNLSGGNKRKLSLAMALIGNPCVLILDEPTTGMDFVARRALWRIISSEKGERSLILTTHHLDEAEAVCSRVAFMERGRFRCLSSIKRLKQKYGDNYSVSIRCAPDKQQNVMDFITAISCGVGQTVEMHSTASKFIIPRGIVSLRQIFEAISNCGLPIWDFRVSHGTLEDIFLQKMGIRR
jgi:ATP-binding cassette subfamily A (ABC1) protein 3